MAASFAPSSASFYPGMHAPRQSTNSGSSEGYVLPVPSGFSVRVFKAPTLFASSGPYQQSSFDKGGYDYRPTQPRQGAQTGHRKLTKPPPPRPQVEQYGGRHGRFGGVRTGPVPETYIYDLALTPANADRHHFGPPSHATGSDADSFFSANSSDSNLGSDPLRPHVHSMPHHHDGNLYGRWQVAHYHSDYPVVSKDGVASNGTDIPSMGSRPLPAPPKDHTQPRHPSRPNLAPLYTNDPCAGRGQWQPDLPHNHGAPQKNLDSLGSESDDDVYPPPGLCPPGWDLPATHRPQRRNSEGHARGVHPRRPVRSQTAPTPRSVRWCEELICPSPILPSQRRKGWFNRRGDQLWRNDGSYKPPGPGEAYPPDLDDYPESQEGWQNEDGIRIDLNHRLIPKVPVRGVLKQTNYCRDEGIRPGYRPDSSPTSDDEE